MVLLPLPYLHFTIRPLHPRILGPWFTASVSALCLSIITNFASSSPVPDDDDDDDDDETASPKWKELVLPASAAVTGPVIVVVEAPTPTVAVAVVAVRPVRNERVAVQPAAVLVSSSPAVARVHLHGVVEAQGSVQHHVVDAGARSRLARPVAWYVVPAGSHVDVQGSAVGLVGGIVLALNLKSPPVQIKGGGFAQQKERG